VVLKMLSGPAAPKEDTANVRVICRTFFAL
jgi:hypothetical protein